MVVLALNGSMEVFMLAVAAVDCMQAVQRLVLEVMVAVALAET